MQAIYIALLVNLSYMLTFGFGGVAKLSLRNTTRSAFHRLLKMASFESSKAENAGRGRATARSDTEGEELQAWRSRIDRSIAKSRKVRGGNYVQIATVDLEGKPACRTVVFRGFLDLPDKERPIAMKMITDARSDKASQIEGNAASEMVWWFSQSSEQYRFYGNLKLIGPAEADSYLISARKQQWGNLSDPAREQFYWPPPGGYSGPAEVPTGGRDSEGKVLDVPDSFLLMLLVPEQVKYLRLTDNYAQKDVLSGGGGDWQVERVNP